MTDGLTDTPIFIAAESGRPLAWALLRIRLRGAGLRMAVNDSWIAATAISRGIPIVTQDDDYVSVPGLDVIHV